MPSDSPNPTSFNPTPTGRARRWTPDSNETSRRESFDGKPYFWAAWDVLKQDVFLIVFKFAADLLRGATVLGAVAFLAAILAFQFGGALEADAGPVAGLTALAERLASPAAIIGTVGLLFCAGLVALMIEVLVLSGVWNAFARGACGENVRPLRTFFSGLSRHFPGVLGLRVCTIAAQITVGLLAVTVLVSIHSATTGAGAFADTSVWMRGFLWAAPLTLTGALALLVRLTMEVAAAPLVLARKPLGASILEAAGLVTRRFVPIYRLLIVAATLMLVPLVLYWGLAMLQNVGLVIPQLAPLLGLLRLAGDVMLYVSAGLVALLFYGALFFFYARHRGLIDELPGGRGDSEEGESAGHRLAHLKRSTDAAAQRGRGLEPGASLEDLLPEEYANIIALDDVLPGAVERAEQSADATDDEPATERAPDDEQGRPLTPDDSETDDPTDDRDRTD